MYLLRSMIPGAINIKFQQEYLLLRCRCFLYIFGELDRAKSSD